MKNSDYGFSVAALVLMVLVVFLAVGTYIYEERQAAIGLLSPGYYVSTTSYALVQSTTSIAVLGHDEGVKAIQSCRTNACISETVWDTGGDPSICIGLPNSDAYERDTCYLTAASIRKDVSICADVSLESSRDACIRDINDGY